MRGCVSFGVSSCKATDPTRQVPALWTSDHANYLSKARLHMPAYWGIVSQHMDLGGHSQSIGSNNGPHLYLLPVATIRQ